MDEQTYSAFLDRIRTAYPDHDLADYMANTDGLVNIAIISQGRVFRFARNEYAIQDLAREIAILDVVRPQLNLAVPQFEVIDPDFVTYPFLAGVPLFRNTILRLPVTQQTNLARQLAEFLQQMHNIPNEMLQAKGISKSGGRHTRDAWLKFYADIQNELFPLMYRSTQTWVNEHFAPLVADAHWLDHEPALIHDDLAQYHILYDAETTQIKGVIDFGTAGLGDPARDYGMLINVYGETLVQQMMPFNDQIQSLLDRARFYAGTFELQWVLGGVRSGENDWFTAHLDRARDVQPYGK